MNPAKRASLPFRLIRLWCAFGVEWRSFYIILRLPVIEASWTHWTENPVGFVEESFCVYYEPIGRQLMLVNALTAKPPVQREVRQVFVMRRVEVEVAYIAAGQAVRDGGNNVRANEHEPVAMLFTHN